jgi:hypothetical protein
VDEHDEIAAYGIRIGGLGMDSAPVPVAPTGWPAWEVVQRVDGTNDAPGTSIWPDEARIGMPGTGEFRLDRCAQRITSHTFERWPPGSLLHPGLASAAAVVALWMGRAAFHAAAVVIDGGAWALLGAQGAGKSTTAAHLADLGCPLLTDDLLVVDGETAFSGPAAIDLRPDAGPLLGGVSIGRVGLRERWRRPETIRALEAPLAGWVGLCWSAGLLSITEPGPTERVGILAEHAGLPLESAHLLNLADRPMLHVSRPPALDDAGSCAVALLEAVRTMAHI